MKRGFVMKKIAFVMSVAILLAMSFCFGVGAMDSSDATYEVPVILMHKQDEKESFGNKYIAQKGLLEVKQGKKTITIFLTTQMKGIEFFYYVNGTLDGEVEQGKAVSNVTVGGETYDSGFEIPIVADGDVCLQFSVPVMPMSPSARLRIDYDNAVLISSMEQQSNSSITEAATVQTTVQTTTVTITQTTENVTEVIPEQTIPQTVTASAVNIADTALYEEKEYSTAVFFLVALIGVAVALAVCVSDKGKKDF